MQKSHPQTSHATRSSHRTLTESFPPIQARVAARLAATEAREPRATGRGKPVRVDEMDPGIQDRLRAGLRDRHGAAALSGGPAKADQARDAMLARFTARELAVHYASRGKAHTLRELIHMLFELADDAGRAHAASFLAPVLG